MNNPKSSDSNALPLKGDALRQIQQQLAGNWKVVDEQRLEREFKFPDFRQALGFVNRVGEIAEKMGHHPDIYLTYGKVRIEISTHKVNGLTENDFLLASKINELDQTG